MFEFYEFNSINIFIVLSSTFIIYNLLCKKNKKNKEKEKENVLDINKLITAGIVSILFSFLILYILAMKKEEILTDNYWDLLEDIN